MTMKDCVSHLSEEIGARPVGTDEEQAAAFYIKEQFEQKAGLPTEIEEFKCSMNPSVPRVAESVICALSAIIAVVSSAFLIPCAIVAVICGILFVLDFLDVFTLNTFLGNAPSQNVVAKYKPSTASTSGRSKKVVLITNYDSEKVRPERGSLKAIEKFLPYIEFGGVIATILFMLLSLIAGANAFFSFMLVVCAIACLVMPLLFVMQQVGQYNAAANCNASSVAVMIDVAEKLNSNTFTSSRPVVYGREAAEAAGVVPENVPVEWENEAGAEIPASEVASPENMNEPLTGETEAFEHVTFDEVPAEHAETPDRQSISQALPAQDLQSSLTAEPEDVSHEVYFMSPEPAVKQISFSEAPKTSSTPDWFTQAKKDAAANTHEPAQPAEIKRSVYSDALEHANNPVEPNLSTANLEAQKTDLEKQLEQIHAQINAAGAEALKTNAELLKEATEEVENMHDAAVAFEKMPAQKEPQLDKNVTLREVVKNSETVDVAEAMPDTVKTDAEVSVPVHNSIFASIPSVSDMASEAPELAEANNDDVPQVPATAENSVPERITVPAEDFATTVIDPVTDETNRLTKEEVSDVKDGGEAASATPRHQVKNEDLSVPLVNRSKPKKRDISLPSLTSAIEADKVAHELQKKADAENERIKAESMNIKEEDEILPSGVVKHSGSEASDALSNLSANLPSLNHASTPAKTSDSTVAVAGAFNVGDATGTFAPIGDELIEGKSSDEIYVDDVDDSDYGTNITETGAMAGPEMVDIPGTRAESVFGKIFHKKKKNNASESFSSGIGVDESFDAREVGKNRGDWSSFADEDEWEGGMFSKAKEKLMGGEDEINYDADYDDNAVSEVEENDVNGMPEQTPISSRKRHTSFGELLAKSNISVSASQEREEVYNFANGPVNYEVWCVTLGAENAEHAGLKAFLNENADDLKGATFVVLNGVGAGELSIAKGDGKLKKSSVPPRLKRYAKAAARKLQIKLPDADLQGRETIASYASDKGFSVLHVAGIENGNVAFDSQKEDTIDVVDEVSLAESSEFISQFLREF